jgi:hypothetical protein
MAVPIELTEASLSQLRLAEWLWRAPNSQIPMRQWIFRILDPVCFGELSRSDLRRAQSGISDLRAAQRRVPGLDDENVFFALVCSAIEINKRFAEAYVWRALSGNEIYATKGKTQRLQGWNHSGSKCFYDVDSAIVDVLIATELKPDWDWALRASGVISCVKAIRLADTGAKADAVQWINFAKHRLDTAAMNAKQLNHTEIYIKARHLIADIDAWSRTGLLPKGSELAELYQS